MKKAVQEILTIYRALMLPVAERRQYKNWHPVFAQQNEARHHEGVANIRVDFSELTSEEATLLGFPLWDESGLRLIPLWLYDHIAVGQTLTDINGVSTFVHEDYMVEGSENYIDNDHRGGATAVGFVPLDLRLGREPA